MDSCLNMQTSFLNVGEWRPQHERQNLDLDVEVIGIKVVYTDITILTTAAETARWQMRIMVRIISMIMLWDIWHQTINSCKEYTKGYKHCKVISLCNITTTLCVHHTILNSMTHQNSKRIETIVAGAPSAIRVESQSIDRSKMPLHTTNLLLKDLHTEWQIVSTYLVLSTKNSMGEYYVWHLGGALVNWV